MNRLFLALLLLFALAFGLAFIADVQGVFSIPDDPIAYVESSSGTVKRLGHQKLTWDRASNGSLFAAKDTIQTGEDSSVKIVFYAGGEMELGPGAMVALGGSLEEVQLNFISGKGRVRVSRKSKNKIKVKSLNQKSKKQGRKNKNSPVSPPTRVEVEVVEKIVTAKKPSQDELKKGSLDRDPEKQKLASRKPKTEPLTQAIKEEVVQKKKNVLKTDGAIISEVNYPDTPKLLYPPDEATVDLSKSLREGSFKWELSDSDKIKGYEVMIKDARSLAKATRVIRSKRPLLSMKRLGQGRFFWSVRAVNEKGLRGPASESRFIEITKPVRKPKPKITSQPRILPVRIE